MELLIGIDIGTTNIKAAAYDRQGNLAAEASQPTPIIQEGLRQAHTDPLVLAHAAACCLRELVSKSVDPGAVVGLAAASVGEAGVLLDCSGQPLFPVIAWYDERTVPQANQVSLQLGDTPIYQTTGLPPGHTYSVHKLLWLQQQHPEVLHSASCWLSVCDWVAFCLGGGRQMGYSQASRTMALDLVQRSWWHTGLKALGLPQHIWPELADEGSRIGSVSPEAANLTGLRAGTPIYIAGHDHVCGALASGVTEPGIILDSTGTTEAELTTIEGIGERLEQANLSFCLGCHAAPGMYYATGGILGAGSLINWLTELYWPEQSNDRGAAIEALSKMAAASPRGANGLYLLPHLAGAGSPDRSSTARGVIAGLCLANNRADLARAVIEGLAYELDALWRALECFTGQSITKVMTVGGGARNTFWNQTKADITGQMLFTPSHSEAVTRGAALLAGVGAGIYDRLLPPPLSPHMPIPLIRKPEHFISSILPISRKCGRPLCKLDG